ncbi:hypothetical protein WJX74_007410 [Apatococcus lobatus]|uniref:Uncharacterized protein n=2 Tax=Apatococcus TaxID=904362 RepID=A0AAW1RFP3_9CHLO
MASGVLTRHAVRVLPTVRGIKYFPGLETRLPADSATVSPAAEATETPQHKAIAPSMSTRSFPQRFANVIPGTRAVNYFPDLPKPEAELKRGEVEPEDRTHDAYAHQPDVMGHSIAGPRSDYFPNHVHVPEGGRRFSLPEMPDVHRHSLMEPMGRNSIMDPSDRHNRRQGIRRSSIQDSMM